MKRNQKIQNANEIVRLYKEKKASWNEACKSAFLICQYVAKKLSITYGKSLAYDEILDISMQHIQAIISDDFKVFDPSKSNFETFIYNSTKNLIKNALKQKNKFSDFQDFNSEIFQANLYYTADTIDLIDYKNILKYIHRILSTQEWTVFYLKYVYKLKAKLIAHVLKTSIQHIRNCIKRITRKLKNNPVIKRYHTELVVG